MWTKVSIAALVVALAGGVFYYQNNEALQKETKACDQVSSHRDGLKKNYESYLAKSNALKIENTQLEKDIATLEQSRDKMKETNSQLAGQIKTNKDDLAAKQQAWADLEKACGGIDQIPVVAENIKNLQEEGKQLETQIAAETAKRDGLKAETTTLAANTTALEKLKQDQDNQLSPPNLRTRINSVLRDYGLVIINGGIRNHGIVPGSKLAVMRGKQKIAELSVNAVEGRVSTATILRDTVAPGEQVEAGDTVVAVR